MIRNMSELNNLERKSKNGENMNEIFKRDYAFLFQGIGIKYRDYLELLNTEQLVMLEHYCSIVNDEIGLNLWDYLMNNETYNLSLKKYCDKFSDSIAIYVIDYIIYQTYIHNNIQPKVLLGYSMGLITALTCGESITFETGIQIQLYVYQYCEHAIRDKEAMAVIIGMNCEAVENLILENGLNNQVEIASENNENCIVISGSRSGVRSLMIIAESEGALRVKKVKAQYAFHSHYAENGIEEYKEAMSKIEVNDSKILVISSFTQKLLRYSSELREELIKNLASRMYWKDSVQQAGKMGITSFVEVSLNDYVTKFTRLIDQDYEFYTYKKICKSNFWKGHANAFKSINICK